jgi:uncharacterized membrane protein
VLFALALLDACIIGAAAVSLSTAYAIGDVLDLRHSLHRKPADAKAFYGVYCGLIALAAALVLTPGTPLGLLTNAVQTLAGVLLPSATVFLLLLCNDKDVLGPWTNSGWLNAIAAMIVGVLVILSAILSATTLFPSVDVARLTEVLFGLLAVGLAATGIYAARGRRRSAAVPRTARAERESWTMPQLELLDKPIWSRPRKVGMITLRGYLVIAVLMLIVKAVELGVGH